MTHHELNQLASEQYGPDWVRQLARNTGIPERTLRRYKAGTHPISEDRELLIRFVISRDTYDLYQKEPKPLSTPNVKTPFFKVKEWLKNLT